MVSIVIPNYNNAKYLKDCVASCPNTCEIIVVDDCSTDNSVDMLNELPVKTIVLPENKGVSTARNEGIIASTGEFVILLDSDDMLIPESVQKRLDIFTPEIDVVYGYMRKVHGDISFSDAYSHVGKWERHPSEFTAPMYRRTVFQRFGLFHEPLRSKEDKEMAYRLGVHRKSYCPPRINFIKADIDVMFYRRHENAKRKRRASDLMFDIETCMEFDKRCKDIEIYGITEQNTRLLK